MKTKCIILILAMLLVPLSGSFAQTQDTPVQTHKTSQVLVKNLDLMAGIMTDINRLMRSGNITLQQRRQIMEIMAQMGGIAQQTGSAKELEGWQLAKQGRKLLDMKMRLDVLKTEIEGKTQ